MNLSLIEWKRAAKSLALFAAAVVLPLAVFAPDSADARQDGISYARSSEDGDRSRLYRRRGASPRSGTYDRDRGDRTRHDGRDYRTQDNRQPRFGGNHGEHTDRRGNDGRDYRNRDDRNPRYSRNDPRPNYSRNDRKRRYTRNDPRPKYSRNDRKRRYSRYDRRRSYAPHRYDPGRTHRHAYRTPSHRHHLHGGHRRLSESYIRGLALRHYPFVQSVEYWNGHYHVRAYDHYGRVYRLAYDAYTGIFLTFVFLGFLGLIL